MAATTAMGRGRGVAAAPRCAAATDAERTSGPTQDERVVVSTAKEFIVIEVPHYVYYDCSKQAGCTLDVHAAGSLPSAELHWHGAEQKNYVPTEAIQEFREAQDLSTGTLLRHVDCTHSGLVDMLAACTRLIVSAMQVEVPRSGEALSHENVKNFMMGGEDELFPWLEASFPPGADATASASRYTNQPCGLTRRPTMPCRRMAPPSPVEVKAWGSTSLFGVGPGDVERAEKLLSSMRTGRPCGALTQSEMALQCGGYSPDVVVGPPSPSTSFVPAHHVARGGTLSSFAPPASATELRTAQFMANLKSTNGDFSLSDDDFISSGDEPLGGWR